MFEQQFSYKVRERWEIYVSNPLPSLNKISKLTQHFIIDLVIQWYTQTVALIKLGDSRKNPHPHDERHPPIHLDFQNCLRPPSLRISMFKDPPPIWICIKLLDTVISLYTQLNDLFIK